MNPVAAECRRILLRVVGLALLGFGWIALQINARLDRAETSIVFLRERNAELQRANEVAQAWMQSTREMLLKANLVPPPNPPPSQAGKGEKQ